MPRSYPADTLHPAGPKLESVDSCEGDLDVAHIVPGVRYAYDTEHQQGFCNIDEDLQSLEGLLGTGAEHLLPIEQYRNEFAPPHPYYIQQQGELLLLLCITCVWLIVIVIISSISISIIMATSP